MRKISKDERQTIDLFLKRVDEAANHFRHIGDDDMADNLYFGAGMVRNLFPQIINKLVIESQPANVRGKHEKY